MVGLFTKNNNFLTTILKLEWNFNATNAQIFYDGMQQMHRFSMMGNFQ